MKYASIFLSHSTVDKDFVKIVARELVRRGVIAWLDINELDIGTNLGVALAEAVFDQTTVAAFLSVEAINSPWVEDELAAAIKKESDSTANDKIIPIFLGDPLEIVRSHKLLRSRWLNLDGNRVDRLGIVPDMAKDQNTLAKEIAQKISRRIFNLINLSDQDPIVIYIDQRGEGHRTRKPVNIPKNIENLDSVALVFRPDMARRSQSETLYGQDWFDVQDTMRSALADALKSPRWPDGKKILILGSGQLAFPFHLGLYFNRNTTADLFCYNIDGAVFTNQNQDRQTPLRNGNSHCETYYQNQQTFTDDAEFDAISLLLATERYVTAVKRFIESQSESPPLIWIKSGIFSDSLQVMEYIADVIALLDRYRDQHGVRTVYLYCGLPFHMLPLLAANLLHVIENVYFMEYRRDLQGEEAPVHESYAKIMCPS